MTDMSFDDLISPETYAVLESVDRDVTKIMQAASISFMKSCNDTREAVAAMDKLVDVMNDFHQRAIYALVASAITSDTGIPEGVLRDYVNGEGARFHRELVHNISHNLRENGVDDIMDANAALREEILGAVN